MSDGLTWDSPDTAGTFKTNAELRAEIEQLQETVRLQAVALCRATGTSQAEWRKFCYSDSVAASPVEPLHLDRMMEAIDETRLAAPTEETSRNLETDAPNPSSAEADRG